MTIKIPLIWESIKKNLIEKIIIPLKPDEKRIYMYTDYAFASTYKVFKILDDFFFSKPEKYLDLGIAEQNMISVSAGISS